MDILFICLHGIIQLLTGVEATLIILAVERRNIARCEAEGNIFIQGNLYNQCCLKTPSTYVLFYEEAN